MAEREWMWTVIENCSPREVVQCMRDLQDRAEFAEWMARRDLVERLLAAIGRTPDGQITQEVRDILVEVENERLSPASGEKQWTEEEK